MESAWAMTFTVTSTADLVDNNVGNGICQTGAGSCTLRAAVQEANANPAADTIQLPANTYAITRAPAGGNDDDVGDFDIRSPLTIVGAGAASTVIDGGQPPAGSAPEVRGLDRLLEIWEEAEDVTVSGVTLQDGYDVESGGAIANFSPGLVRLQNVNVKTSYAGVFGGGIATESVGRTEIAGGLFEGNATGGEGGAIYNQHEAELTVSDAAFTDNRAGADGGGIANVSKTRLTITRGTFSGNVSGGSGGGVFSDTQRPATVTGSVFTANEAGDPVSGDGGGGGLYAGGDGAVTIAGSTFTENTAIATGGGLVLASGAASSVTDTFVRDNHALGGAGVQHEGQGVTLRRLTITGNVAEEDGGGIQSEGSGTFQILDTRVERNRALHGGGFANVADGTLTVSGTTFWDNRATLYGGGVYNASDATALIENTTISGNVAQTSGGGLYSDADAGLRVVNATITLNLSPYGAGVGHEPGGSVNFPVEPSTSVLFRNTLVAGNLVGAECSFAVGSEGGNLDSGDSCYFRGSRDRLNAGNPRIDAIADNGVPTMTHAIQSDSYALDGGVSPCVLTDERGISRPKNTTCDIGAYEHEGPFPAADNVDPQTSVLTGPTVAAERAVFTFAATDNVSPPAEILYECRLEPVDADPNEPPEPEHLFTGCTNPYELLEFEPGPNTLQVRAIDRAGNVDETPAEWEFTGGEDTTPPQTTFASVPPNPSAGRTATFSFQGTDDMTPAFLLEYECRIDSTSEEAWLECASPWSFSDLTTGSHTVEVRAIDEGDNVDPTPATYT
ncbi:choice-of-anchor Q domain-containing protein [Asanoa siamensis]|nr:choice-of-anchor Q domain-containing protein [Asanoa siamensis]